jgi:hypothetical protein
MSFTFAGSMTGGAPVVRLMQVGETCYEGCLLNHSHQAADCTGYVWLADVAAQDAEDDKGIVGFVSGVHTYEGDAGFSGTTGWGNTATTRTTQAQMVANRPVGQTQVEMTVIVSNDTLVSAPLYNGAYGTAITELVVTAVNAAGTTITHTGITGIDYADDYGVAYCRSGANHGHYRTMITPGTAEQVVHVPFPYDMAVDDVYVTAGGVPGITGAQIGSTANYFNAADTLSNHFSVWLHEQNLEESGKEYYTVAFLASACGFTGFQGL